jgi:hypothetical protein
VKRAFAAGLVVYGLLAGAAFAADPRPTPTIFGLPVPTERPVPTVVGLPLSTPAATPLRALPDTSTEGGA